MIYFILLSVNRAGLNLRKLVGELFLKLHLEHQIYRIAVNRKNNPDYDKDNDGLLFDILSDIIQCGKIMYIHCLFLRQIMQKLVRIAWCRG